MKIRIAGMNYTVVENGTGQIEDCSYQVSNNNLLNKRITGLDVIITDKVHNDGLVNTGW